jgi:hypothetical protein
VRVLGLYAVASKGGPWLSGPLLGWVGERLGASAPALLGALTVIALGVTAGVAPRMVNTLAVTRVVRFVRWVVRALIGLLHLDRLSGALAGWLTAVAVAMGSGIAVAGGWTAGALVAVAATTVGILIAVLRTAAATPAVIESGRWLVHRARGQPVARLLMAVWVWAGGPGGRAAMWLAGGTAAASTIGAAEELFGLRAVVALLSAGSPSTGFAGPQPGHPLITAAVLAAVAVVVLLPTVRHHMRVRRWGGWTPARMRGAIRAALGRRPGAFSSLKESPNGEERELLIEVLREELSPPPRTRSGTLRVLTRLAQVASDRRISSAGAGRAIAAWAGAVAVVAVIGVPAAGLLVGSLAGRVGIVVGGIGAAVLGLLMLRRSVTKARSPPPRGLQVAARAGLVTGLVVVGMFAVTPSATAFVANSDVGGLPCSGSPGPAAGSDSSASGSSCASGRRPGGGGMEGARA